MPTTLPIARLTMMNRHLGRVSRWVGDTWTGFVGYWTSLAILTLAIAAVLATALAGLAGSLSALTTGDPLVVVATTIGFVLLIWPSVGVTVSSLLAGHSKAWWSVAFYPLAILVFMATTFGKPVDLVGDGVILRAMPIMLLSLMTAWLITEHRAARALREAVRRL